jgi:hypothetical protein
MPYKTRIERDKRDTGQGQGKISGQDKMTQERVRTEIRQESGARHFNVLMAVPPFLLEIRISK